MFQQGLSGLNAASKSLDVIGNNIANASTVGFKGSQAQFADLYANSLNGVSGNNAGIGVSVSRLAQQFTQGNIETSNNPLDISINGGGFFRTTTPSGGVQYSRNGQFQLDKTGTIINAQGNAITGYPATSDGVILQGAPEPIKIDTADLVPVATTKANYELNLDSRSKVPEKIPFNAKDPLTYNKQTVLDVYDTLGNPHVLSTYYVKTDANTWDVYVASDGMELNAATVAAAVATDPGVIQARLDYQTAVNTGGDVAAANLAYSAAAGAAMQAVLDAIPGVTPQQSAALAALYDGSAADVGGIVGTNPDAINLALSKAISAPPSKAATLVFDQKGALSTTAMANLPSPQSMPFTLTLPIFPNTGSVAPLTISTGFTGTTQYGTATSEKASTQDGYSSGHLERFAAGADGVILGQYSNGKSRPLGQIVLVNFANNDGLTPLGNNAWAESSTSGTPQVGIPGTGANGQLRSSSVETSNVDLTAELVNMITAQRVYQANSQTIKTQDQVLQTLVNLR